MRSSGMRELPVLLIYSLLGWYMAYLLNSIEISAFAALMSVILVSRWTIRFTSERTNMMRLLTLTAALLCLYQNIAWLTVLYLHTVELNSSIDYTMASLFRGNALTTSDYFLAICYVTLFCFALSIYSNLPFIRENERKLFKKIMTVEQLPKRHLRIYLIVLFSAQMLLIFSGLIGHRTYNVEGFEDGKLPVWHGLLMAVIPFYEALMILLTRKKYEVEPFKYVEFALYLVPVAFLAFSEGRRSIVYLVLTLLFWWYLFGGRLSRRRVIIGLFLIPFFGFILVFNNFMRRYETDLQGFSSVSEALSLYVNSRDIITESRQKSLLNVSTRPLVASPLAACLAYPEYKKTFTLGENFFNSIMWALPRQLIPDKSKYPVQEKILYKHFPFGEHDTADSIYLAAYTEFGWLGIIIYPMLLVGVWYMVMRINLSYADLPVVFTLLSIGVFFDSGVIRIAESSLIWMIVHFRTLFMLLVLTLLFPSSVFHKFRHGYEI